jgi:hypothetical protein
MISGASPIGKPAANGVTYKVTRKRVASLLPSPENERLYRAVEDDPDIVALAKSIKLNGLNEPLIVTADNYIVSGHRRRAALERIGQVWVPCRVLPVRRDSMPTDRYIALLRDHNRQRNKTVAEQLHEEVVDIDPEQAHLRLRERRLKSVYAPEYNGVQVLQIEGDKRRYNISEDKADHVKYINKIVFEERRKYWPLSVRGVHYPLLNFKFIRGYYWPPEGKPGHGAKRTLWYANDDNSYQATSDLITRLRLNGSIPWEAFDDPTRPLKEFHPFANAREFVRQEAERLLDGYWRDYLQTQPNYIEVVCEKNTIYHMVLSVTEKYQIWTMSGRGFNSIDPWHDIYERYLASGKRRLIVIVLSDYDPEGEMIPHVGGRTLLGDFGVPRDDLTIIKAGVTREQIDRYQLPSMNFAKESSSNRDWFVRRNGGDDTVWELEAMEPADMCGDLDNTIRNVIDIDLFNREVEAEKEDAAYLEAERKRIMKALKGLGD